MNIEMIEMLWNNSDNHDKIWIAFKAEDGFYAAWGKRDCKLSFKKHNGQWALHTLASQKKRKNYKEIDKICLFTLFPDIEEKIVEELFMKTLSGKVK